MITVVKLSRTGHRTQDSEAAVFVQQWSSRLSDFQCQKVEVGALFWQAEHTSVRLNDVSKRKGTDDLNVLTAGSPLI